MRFVKQKLDAHMSIQNVSNAESLAYNQPKYLRFSCTCLKTDHVSNVFMKCLMMIKETKDVMATLQEMYEHSVSGHIKVGYMKSSS